ncbi:MAG: hypothetical protein H6828_10280 [Planctomycetes bacterium]|nr:hypothetical protein [Planctomycetota bacterium]
MNLPDLPLLALPLLAACAATGGAAPHPEAPSALTLAQFEGLKGLAGDWYAADEDGRPTGDLVLSYRVISNGSTLVERDFPGQPHEMVTAYSLDGGELVLTHYCALGNAPHMRAVPEGDASEVHFECVRLGNAASHDDLHMHDAVFHLGEPGHLRSTWTLWVDGELGQAEDFVLVRG